MVAKNVQHVSALTADAGRQECKEACAVVNVLEAFIYVANSNAVLSR